MVTDYGMSDKLGTRTFGNKQEMVFLGREITTERDYSEKVAAKIDEEVKIFIDRAHKVAKDILTKNRRALEAVASTLKEKEVLEQEEFNAILKPFKLKPIAA